MRRCYGETYPDAELYDAGAIAEAVRTGLLRSHVGIDERGRLVGHLGVRLDTKEARIGTATVAVVDPAFRRQGLMLAMGSAMYAECRAAGIVGLRLLATTAHRHTQGPSISSGADATGVLLGHIPPETRYEGVETAAEPKRIASLVLYHGFAPAPPRAVHVPERYRAIVEAIYAGVSLERRVLAVRTESESLRVEVREEPKRGVLRLVRSAAGITVDAALASARQPVCYADVDLAAAAAPGWLEALRGYGFHLGALLPGAGSAEVLRLQRVAGSEIAPQRVEPSTPLGRRVLAAVLRDRVEVGAD